MNESRAGNDSNQCENLIAALRSERKAIRRASKAAGQIKALRRELANERATSMRLRVDLYNAEARARLP